MSKRPEGVFPHADGWGFVFQSVHPRPDGGRRQVRRSGFATAGEASKARTAAQIEDRGTSAPTPGLTVSAVLRQFVRTKELAGKAPGTIAQYEWASRRLEERFGTKHANKLTSEHLDELYLELLGGGRRQHVRTKGTTTTTKAMAPRSVLILHKTIKAALQLAVDKGQLVRNVARLATPPSGVAEDVRPHWTPSEVGQFLVFMATRKPVDSAGKRERAVLPVGLVDMLADTGGRRGEVLGLRWSEVDLEGGTAAIVRQLVADPRTKRLTIRVTKRPRSKSIIGLHPDTVDALKRRRRAQLEERMLVGAGWPTSGIAEDLVFTWPDGSPIHPDAMSKMIARLSVEAGLPRITAHGLRHSFATAALAVRVPVEVVAARLGNTARVVQETYSHVIPADDQAAAQIVGDLYRGQSASG
jgi:integrase